MASSASTNQYIRQVLHHSEPPPLIEARFFYTSPLAIDDPLSPLPPPATAGTTTTKQRPRPFSEYDNAALDKAWLELRRKILKYNEERGEKSKSADVQLETRQQGDASQESQKQGKRKEEENLTPRLRSSTWGGHENTPSGSDAYARLKRSNKELDGAAQSRHAGIGLGVSESLQTLDGPMLPADADVPNTTGTPFLRAPSRTNVPRTGGGGRSTSRGSRPEPHVMDSYKWDDTEGLQDIESLEPEQKTPVTEGPTDKVAVGVSRLHQVAMPDLQMEPIYWEPVHDIAAVARGTWFYKDTMYPVETPVANMLEAGYVELRPWTETWNDELNSAVEVGAAGEMKVLHRLWPEVLMPQPDSRPGTARGEATAVLAANLADTEPDTPEKERERAVEAACDIIDISTGAGGPDNKAAGAIGYGRGGPARLYPYSGVIYANATEAHILKPNLQPSTYYGRRPLANYIRKGRKLGISVVRGFDQAAWDRLYPPKRSATLKKAQEGVSSSQSGAPPNRRQKNDAELEHSERPRVTELVLVIHGIGQKLSERMESFHFTHAINAFRREVNVELGENAVKANLRRDMGGIMVLPVNWRHRLSFEEGGYRDGPEDLASNQYTLKDITPDTLPSVRNIVSDVMLDIPYYLSHHQPKMIAAAIKEANRIYQLWCTNNPGFGTKYGRVHVIAHSLGSVMAMDILSRQPTTLPPSLADPTQVDLSTASPLPHFLFPTSNLFLAGSPAGFFLLLKRASLLPRLNHTKPGADPSSNTALVCGEQGTYGCLAVDNLYNIINPYDPVSYRLNAAVDASHAHALKPAWIPSAAPGWFASSPSTRWFGGSREGVSKNQQQQPALPCLPSNVELETHNFSREEIAEDRMMLLNDNGQIDYLLQYGGGPLEIQYLTMLGAHSSYWASKDFVRMIVLECGRERGKEGALVGMRAVKRKVQLA